MLDHWTVEKLLQSSSLSLKLVKGTRNNLDAFLADIFFSFFTALNAFNKLSWVYLLCVFLCLKILGFF